MLNYIKEVFDNYSKNKNWKGLIVKLRYDEELRKELEEATNFLPNDETTSISERVFYYKENLKEIQKCPYCNKKRRFEKLDKGLFVTCGSKECKHLALAKSSQKEKNYVEIQKKMRETYFKKTGYTHNMKNPNFIKKMNDKKIKWGILSEKAKINRNNSIKEKYGSLSNMFKEGMIKKYGSISNCCKVYQNKRTSNKIKKELDILLNKLNNFNFSYISNIQDDFLIKCDKCGLEIHKSRQSLNYYLRNNIRFCPKCDYKNMTFRSNFEKDVSNEIKKFYNKEIEYNKYIGKYECDIIIPDKKIAIECNGVYWHTEEYKDKNFHQNKKIAVENEGYNLIQIWEDNWNDKIKKEIIISRLKIKLGYAKKIYARKCEIKEVTGSETKEFLENNHLQGYIPSTYKIGLFYNNKLVEIITLGKTRKLIGNKENTLELYRLCSEKNYIIVGGFSKLLKYFNEHYNIENKKIISYSDCDWVKIKNNGYLNSGFSLIKLTAPDYSWLVDNIRRNRLNFTKKKLINENNKDLSEVQIMHQLGYKRIFGSGNLLLEYKKDLRN